MSATVSVPFAAPDREARNFAMLAQLFGLFGWVAAGVGHIVCPLLLYFIKRDEAPFVAFHALQTTFFHLAWSVAFLVLVPIMIFSCVLIPAVPFVLLIWLFFSISGTVAAARGEWSRYPVVGQWALNIVIARQANNAGEGSAA